MNKKIKKVVTGALIGTMTLSMAGMAFADDQVKKPVDKVRLTHEQMQEKINGVFDEAVSKGIITQEQKDQLLENKFMNLSQEEIKEKMEERLAQAVKDGKMTQEQADKILENGPKGFEKGNRPSKEDREELKNLSQEERQEKMEEKLAQAVKDGKMTQEQADKILENGPKGFEKGNRPQKEDREELENLSQEERQEKMKERLAQDVKDGKLTQEQADKMLERMENGKNMDKKKLPENRILQRGVKEGIITQEQADEITKIAMENIQK